MSKPAALATLAMLMATLACLSPAAKPDGTVIRQLTGSAENLARIPTVTTARFPSLTPRPTATVLVISISDVAPNISDYDRVAWKHWTDSEGDCRNTRQQVLADESVMPVTFETDRNCRIETGRWYGAFTGNYEEVPDIVDIDHLVPLKNAHNSGG